MAQENGNISISTENIFPIIKKWLYSEKDIFIRELVSNASDAISKLKKLSTIGEAKVDENNKFFIKVTLNKDEKTIVVEDNGIGMTYDEVKKYINQIAFSGAKDFLEKYKDKAEDSQIIGHFGLGFYSAFMVADRVEIDTLSHIEGSEAVRWVSSEGTDYEMSASDKTDVGTAITLYMAEDSQEYLDMYPMEETLRKYFSFLPYELFIEDVTPKKEEDKKEDKKEDAADKEEDIKEELKPINDTHPLWLKNPKDCTDEEYKDFYKKVFHDFNDPLFWIHLNMDYPFSLKGILFFPKLKHEFEMNEGQIKLYYNQVFVADNIKDVIPEFLMLLKGVLDCPDLPLNVSRSFLQNDGYVTKISTHITKKVADKLNSIFENDRETYNKYWDDINPFVKYGCIRQDKFYDKVKDSVIYKTTNDDYITLKDYLERNKEKHKDKVFYVSDPKQQSQYIKMFKDNDMEAILLSTMIDNHFITFIESKESGTKFSRIDSDLSDNLKQAEDNSSFSDTDIEGVKSLFKDVLGNEKLDIQVEALKSESVPGMIILSESSRRMQEMSRMFGGMDMKGMFPEEQTFILNKNNNLVKSIINMKNKDKSNEDVTLLCEHIYDLAMLSHKQLEPEAMAKFIDRSTKVLEKIAAV